LGRVKVGVRVRVKARVDDQQLVAAEGLRRGWGGVGEGLGRG
jgi:hypothetical protein